jgi:DNA polymerase-3 subunit epsilon/CBS domain-containing protein
MATASYSTPLVALDAVVLDTETTGIDARTARIVQIGAVRISGTKLLAQPRYERLINPGQPIPEATVAVHGITDALVADAPRFTDVISELESFIASSIVIGHAIAYDLGVLEREYRLAGKIWRPPRALDVRALARIAAPTLAHYTLDQLCEWLGIEVKGRHSAIGDALMTARVFAALVPHLRQQNIRTLAEAEAASRILADAEARAAGGLAVAPGGVGAAETTTLARVESFAYRHRVSDVMSSPPAFAPPATTVRELLALLLEKKVSSVFVRADSGETGIVTERDALREIDARGPAGLDTRLDAIMKKPLQTILDHAFVYRAVARMQRLGIRHLGVRNTIGEIVGAVTSRNLLQNRAVAALALGDEIDSAADSTALGQAWAKLPIMARGLIAEDVEARAITAVISSEISILTRRAAQLAEARMEADGKGRPPVSYAVLVLGSAGRGESLLAADQDNAIVYERGSEGGPEDRYFEALATHMCAILDEVGVHYCRGGVMAKNRAWRMSLQDWRATIEAWVRRQRPEDLLNVDIFYDGMAVHGDGALGEDLWQRAYELGHRAPDFLVALTEVARDRGQPFTLFGNFRVDDKGRIDLKKVGLMPIFGAARVLSIKHDVRVRSTPERLRGVAAKGIGSASEIEGIIEAHGTILSTVLGQQLADAEGGIPLSSRVAVNRLDNAARRTLRDALGRVDAVLDLVREGRF